MDNKEISTLIKVNRVLFLLFSSLFFIAVLSQIFLAGLAIFVNPIYWMKHTTFIHVFGFNIPVLLFLLSYFGKLPQWSYIYVFGLISGVFFMYFTANFTNILRWLGALHPIIAVFLVILSFLLVKKTTLFIFQKRSSELI
ncbi:DUF6220 domain-containing protein [Caldibacillus thermolactis]|uniref:DUF6220 domain-containing protein n=1 Tax=Pallidibacillus thermolactis TaxID=251051 RepID=A0ABT2WJ86_9BACI|nr:DUF6220 domain-containing protein [Pallidibacillus thermolactis]MCU9595740.1 DUF6220 domain-containing protein [Pallidibacillus thermolactis]